MFNGLILMATPQASGGANAGGSQYGFFIMLILLFAVMYFFMLRPQQKREKQRQKMLADLKKGDKVITNGGMVGTIWGIKDNIVVLKVDEEVKIEFLKSAIAGKME